MLALPPNENKISHRWRGRAQSPIEVLRSFESCASGRPAVGCIAWLDGWRSPSGRRWITEALIAMSPHLALLNVHLNHIVMVPQSLCGLRISGLGGSLVAGDLLWRETKTLIEECRFWSALAASERHASE